MNGEKILNNPKTKPENGRACGQSTAPCSVDRLRVLDLFSGIGGFSLGLERAGMETVAFCEIEKFPRQVLRKHWPDVPIFEDVRKLHAEDLPEAIDLICGGYPCQPFSVAGKRRGHNDDRHLWPEVLRLVRECKPTWVVCENVTGHISMGLDQVLTDLEGEGYACWTFVLPAVALNAPHRRDRLWIIANAQSERLEEGKQWDISSWEDSGWQRERRLADLGSYGGSEQEWGIRPCFDRKSNGFPRWMDRIKSLGNAVVPQIPEIIGRAILAQAT